jgi:hypothetical protein
MKKQQVDHVLRAAGRITGEKQFIIVGSQSLHGKHPDIADDILRSFEVDLIAERDPSRVGARKELEPTAPPELDRAPRTPPRGNKPRGNK